MRRFPFSERSECRVFSALGSPARVQDFLNELGSCTPRTKETCRSPFSTLRDGTADCFEGALLAAAIFWSHGRPPFLFDLETTPDDEPHVLALFRERGYWGAVSKTSHSVLRFRDPVYRTLRELALSYFHEYFLDTGVKTLRRFSRTPFDLLAFEDEWVTAAYPVWGVHDALAHAPHERVVPPQILVRLRRADPLEIAAGKLTGQK